jgi:RNA polymerase sigma factor (sigma-70 family)
VRRLKAGEDDLRFEIPYNYTALIWKYVNFFCRDHPDLDPDDLSQDILIHLSEKIYDFDESYNTQVITYLTTQIIWFIKHRIRDHRNRTKRQISIFKIIGKDEDFLASILIDEDCKDPSQHTLDVEVAEYLETHASQLNQLERKVIESIVAGYTIKEIADMASLKRSKIKEVFSLAKRKLRISMEDHHTINFGG